MSQCSHLIIRTDNGSQFVSRTFQDAIISWSKTRVHKNHTPEQNGHVESFHKTLKKEYLWPCEFANYQDAETVIADACRDYNHSRIYSALGYVTPEEFLSEWGMRNK